MNYQISSDQSSPEINRDHADFEVSKALAVAIGWTLATNGSEADGSKHVLLRSGRSWKVFDYRDPEVIWPISARFNCEHRKSGFQQEDRTWQARVGDWRKLEVNWETAKTAELAIAFAVIHSKATLVPNQDRQNQELVYDFELRAPACVLLQAAFGCGSHPDALRLFEPKHWLTSPTPGMRKVSGTPEQWQQAALATQKAWGAQRAEARPTKRYEKSKLQSIPRK
jgi:hypothetical protein